MTLLLTDSESDASDYETDVPNAWTVDLARYKDEDPIAETENPLTWWRLNRNRFPVLVNFVKKLYCVSRPHLCHANGCLVPSGTSWVKHVRLFCRKVLPHWFVCATG